LQILRSEGPIYMGNYRSCSWIQVARARIIITNYICIYIVAKGATRHFINTHLHMHEISFCVLQFLQCIKLDLSVLKVQCPMVQYAICHKQNEPGCTWLAWSWFDPNQDAAHIDIAKPCFLWRMLFCENAFYKECT
jgi:hypothetical protein